MSKIPRSFEGSVKGTLIQEEAQPSPERKQFFSAGEQVAQR